MCIFPDPEILRQILLRILLRILRQILLRILRQILSPMTLSTNVWMAWKPGSTTLSTK